MIRSVRLADAGRSPACCCARDPRIMAAVVNRLIVRNGAPLCTGPFPDFAQGGFSLGTH